MSWGRRVATATARRVPPFTPFTGRSAAYTRKCRDSDVRMGPSRTVHEEERRHLPDLKETLPWASPLDGVASVRVDITQNRVDLPEHAKIPSRTWSGRRPREIDGRAAKRLRGDRLVDALRDQHVGAFSGKHRFESDMPPDPDAGAR